MTTTQILKQEALRVNDLLTRYIDVHNKFLKSAGTFWSLFRKVNFKDLSEEIYEVFEDIQDEFAKIGEIATPDSEVEKKFLEVLTKYAQSLMNTSHLLFVMARALKSKAEGEKLSMSDHMANDKKYKDSIEEYMELGAELNRLFGKLED